MRDFSARPVAAGIRPAIAPVALSAGSRLQRLATLVDRSRPADLLLIAGESTPLVPADIADVAAGIDPFSSASHGSPPVAIVTNARLQRG
jgi:hypothetical protein